MIYKALVALAAVLLVSMFPSGSHTSASTTTALRFDTVTHGVKLSLIMLDRTYPMNALIRVTVRLQNVSRHIVLVSGNNGPTVVVLDSAKQVVYWPSDPFFGQEQQLFEPSAPRRLPIKLAPSKSLAATFFVVLRGPLLQVQAVLGAPAQERKIHGASVPLTLTYEVAPTVVVSDTPTIHTTISPPLGVSGPPYFVEQTQCTASNSVSGTWEGWVAASSGDLTPDFAPDCVSNRKWTAYAGWLGHPIATINYSEP